LVVAVVVSALFGWGLGGFWVALAGGIGVGAAMSLGIVVLLRIDRRRKR